MINRELMKENNEIIQKERVLPFKKVEELLSVNAKLRALLTLRSPKNTKQESILVTEAFPTSTTKDPSFVQVTQTSRDPVAESQQPSTRNEYTEEIEALKLKIAGLEHQNEDLKKKVQAAQASNFLLKSLETKLKKSEEQNAQLRSQAEQSAAELAKLKAELAENKEIEKEVSLLKAEFAKKDEEIRSFKEYIYKTQALLSQMEELQRDRDIFEKVIDERDEEIQALKQKIDSLEPLTKENKLLKQRYFLVRTASELLRNRIEEQHVMMDKMQKLVNTDELLDVEIDYRKLAAERDVLAAQNERMKKPIKEKVLKLDLLKLKLSAELEEVENLKNSIRHLDESQVISKFGHSPLKTPMGQESGRSRDELVKTLEQRSSTMRNLHNRWKDVETIKIQLDDMNRELERVKSEENLDTNPVGSDSFSARVMQARLV